VAISAALPLEAARLAVIIYTHTGLPNFGDAWPSYGDLTRPLLKREGPLVERTTPFKQLNFGRTGQLAAQLTSLFYI